MKIAKLVMLVSAGVILFAGVANSAEIPKISKVNTTITNTGFSSEVTSVLKAVDCNSAYAAYQIAEKAYNDKNEACGVIDGLTSTIEKNDIIYWYLLNLESSNAVNAYPNDKAITLKSFLVAQETEVLNQLNSAKQELLKATNTCSAGESLNFLKEGLATAEAAVCKKCDNNWPAGSQDAWTMLSKCVLQKVHPER